MNRHLLHTASLTAEQSGAKYPDFLYNCVPPKTN